MNTTINIIAASVFGVGISAGAVLYIGTSHQAKQIVPAPVVVEAPAPAPVVVTPPRVDSVTITTNDKMTFTALRKNVSCYTRSSVWHTGETVQYRYCSAFGILTDLAGKQTHYSSEDKMCFSKYGDDNWTNSGGINSMACSAAIDLGAS